MCPARQLSVLQLVGSSLDVVLEVSRLVLGVIHLLVHLAAGLLIGALALWLLSSVPGPLISPGRIYILLGNPSLTSGSCCTGDLGPRTRLFMI